jgi:hypothetical protein
MAMVANSACTERVFSKFGAVHTKVRNRMHPEKVRKMTLLKMDIVQTYGPPPRSRKRKFGDDDGTLTSSPPDQPTPTNQSTSATTSTETSSNNSDSDSDDSIPTFSDVVQGLIQDSDSDEPTAHPPSTFRGHESRLLKNIFQYPTPSEPSPASLKFMNKYWAKGEDHLRRRSCGCFCKCTRGDTRVLFK